MPIKSTGHEALLHLFFGRPYGASAIEFRAEQHNTMYPLESRLRRKWLLIMGYECLINEMPRDRC